MALVVITADQALRIAGLLSVLVEAAESPEVVVEADEQQRTRIAHEAGTYEAVLWSMIRAAGSASGGPGPFEFG